MTLRLNGDNSGFSEIKAADNAGNNSIKLPASNGSANELLKNGGTAGELEYATGVSADTSGNVNATAIRSGGVTNTLDGAPLTSHLTTNRNALTIQRLDGISAGQTTGIMFRQEYTTGSGNGRRMGFFGIERASSSSGDQRANFVMELCPDNSTNVGSASPNSSTQLFKFTSSGRLQFLKSGGGIDFSGIQTNAAGMSSETLDSYEEGTWTPAGANNFNGISGADGAYVKVGKIVWVSYQFSYTSLDSTTQASAIQGLPFAPGNANPDTGVEATGVAFGTNKLILTYAEITSTIYFEMDRLLSGTESTAGDFLRGSMVYSI